MTGSPFDEAEKEVLLAFLAANKGNVTQTAKELGRNRNTIRKMILRHKIDVARMRPKNQSKAQREELVRKYEEGLPGGRE